MTGEQMHIHLEEDFTSQSNQLQHVHSTRVERRGNEEPRRKASMMILDSTKLKAMTGERMHIHLEEDYQSIEIASESGIPHA